MDRLTLCGRSILVIEHDRNVAFELANQLRRRGAKVFAAANLRDAQHMAEHPALAAVVTGLRIGRADTSALCRRLSYLGIPFMFHTSFDPAGARQIWPDAPILNKPAKGEAVLRALVTMLDQDPRSAPTDSGQPK